MVDDMLSPDNIKVMNEGEIGNSNNLVLNSPMTMKLSKTNIARLNSHKLKELNSSGQPGRADTDETTEIANKDNNFG